MQHRAIFLDKDGTLIQDIPYNVDPSKISLLDGVREGLRELTAKGFLLIVISNQAGVAHGHFTIESLEDVKTKIKHLLSPQEVTVHGFYFCPHHPDGAVNPYAILCECRKPMPGMLLEAAKDFDINLSESWMIGDILHDIEAGKAAGCHTILIDNGNETEWVLTPERIPEFTAKNFREAVSYILMSQTTS